MFSSANESSLCNCSPDEPMFFAQRKSLLFFSEATMTIFSMQNCVFLQICILMVFGVWPFWKFPFRRCKLLNTLLALYSTCVNLLWITKMFRRLQHVIEDYTTEESKSFLFVKTFSEFFVRFSILHAALFRNHRIVCCETFVKQQKSGKAKRISCLIFVVLVVLMAVTIFSSFSRLQKHIAFKLPANGDALHYFQAVIDPIQVIIRHVFQVTSLPTVLVLSHSCSIHHQFKDLEETIGAHITSKEIFKDSKLFSDIKNMFWDTCEVANKTNQTFRYYLFAAIVTICFNIFAYTYRWSMQSCNYETETYFSLLMCEFLALLILCVSGTLITSAVSIFARFLANSARCIKWIGCRSLFWFFSG